MASKSAPNCREISGDTCLKSSLCQFHGRINARGVTCTTDYRVILRKYDCELLNGAFHQITRNYLNPKISDLSDKILFGWFARHYGILT